MKLFSGDEHWELDANINGKADNDPLDVSLTPVDPVLLEMLMAVQLLAESPRVIELEEIIRGEARIG